MNFEEIVQETIQTDAEIINELKSENARILELLVGKKQCNDCAVCDCKYQGIVGGSLWHTPDKEPEKQREIFFEYKCVEPLDPGYEIETVFEGRSWEGIKNEYAVMRWVYVHELIKATGGQEE